MNGKVISCRRKYFVLTRFRELIEVRDGRKLIAGLDKTELLDLLDCVYRIIHMYSLF